MSTIARFMKASNKPEVYPIVGILSIALSGAGFFGYRAMKAPDVVWSSRTNPYPWQAIKDGEQVKLITMNQKYKHRWQRKDW
ncbi:hypothetical protein BDF20DRAFT_900873 [Mycotypha africana]|uniref:uncharacterized protein n=1 Tax=Mycotypha africana TaxID=64632 RepID=UPI002301C1CA|nr:uncharacterized protein BDF20DRAFT_900873 [Mycotypha africana]KAI8967401.1 hypothetical protein BDF20DRAFT_900873 [Mycotypha africana]